MASYSSPPVNVDQVNFWENFFKNRSDDYEWYCGWNEIQKHVGHLLHKDTNVLNVGCGSSPFSADLYDSVEGINITNVDFSPVCIRMMLMKNLRSRPRMKWLVQDCTSMPKIKSATFDVVIDKGCMYSMMYDDGISAKMLLKQVRRVLRKGGIFCIITLITQDILFILLRSSEAVADGEGCVKFELLEPTVNERNEAIQPFLITLSFNRVETEIDCDTLSTINEKTVNIRKKNVQEIDIAFSANDGQGETANLVQAVHAFLYDQQERRKI
eukprot:CFRG5938T1